MSDFIENIMLVGAYVGLLMAVIFVIGCAYAVLWAPITIIFYIIFGRG